MRPSQPLDVRAAPVPALAPAAAAFAPQPRPRTSSVSLRHALAPVAAAPDASALSSLGVSPSGVSDVSSTAAQPGHAASPPASAPAAASSGAATPRPPNMAALSYEPPSRSVDAGAPSRPSLSLSTRSSLDRGGTASYSAGTATTPASSSNAGIVPSPSVDTNGTHGMTQSASAFSTGSVPHVLDEVIPTSFDESTLRALCDMDVSGRALDSSG